MNIRFRNDNFLENKKIRTIVHRHKYDLLCRDDNDICIIDTSGILLLSKSNSIFTVEQFINQLNPRIIKIA